MTQILNALPPDLVPPGPVRPGQLPPGQAPTGPVPDQAVRPRGVLPPVPPPRLRSGGPGATRAGPGQRGRATWGGSAGTVSACTVRARPVSAEDKNQPGVSTTVPHPGPGPGPGLGPRRCRIPAWQTRQPGGGRAGAGGRRSGARTDGAAAWAEHPDADRRCSLDANSGGHRDRSRDGASCPGQTSSPVAAGSPRAAPASSPSPVVAVKPTKPDPSRQARRRSRPAPRPRPRCRRHKRENPPGVLLADNFERARRYGQLPRTSSRPNDYAFNYDRGEYVITKINPGAASGADGDPQRPVRQHGDRD